MGKKASDEILEEVIEILFISRSRRQFIRSLSVPNLVITKNNESYPEQVDKSNFAFSF